MERFSVSILPCSVRLYTCSPHVFRQILLPFSCLDWGQDVLTLTVLEGEVTFYVYDRPDEGKNQEAHTVLRRFTTADPRRYLVYDLHEDIPGIDHVGIIHHISGLFLERNIPILYVNTFGHNLVFVSDEHRGVVSQVLGLGLELESGLESDK